jgi:hypothetical protein
MKEDVMDEARKARIKEALFKAMWEQIVLRHLLPASKGSLGMEIQQLSVESGIPTDEVNAVIKDYLNITAMIILSREAARLPQAV